MGGVLFGLYHTHKKLRTEERAKREQYWREQVRWLLSRISSPVIYF